MDNLETFFQLFLALLLGSMIGLERELARKTAGMRTFALVAMGSCLFSVISAFVSVADPTRIASQIVVGIGFIGAGLIFKRDENKSSTVLGLTTATTLWVAAAIGMAVGFKLYWLAISTTFLALLVLVVFWYVEHGLINSISSTKEDDN